MRLGNIMKEICSYEDFGFVCVIYNMREEHAVKVFAHNTRIDGKEYYWLPLDRRSGEKIWWDAEYQHIPEPQWW